MQKLLYRSRLAKQERHDHVGVSQVVEDGVGGLALNLLGTATTTDLISLREVFHALNLPAISALVIGTA